MLGLFLKCLALGVSSFIIGIIPLTFMLSKAHLEILSSLGTGLLLGTALGVVVPEGMETLAENSNEGVPTTRIALSLLFGFTFMLLVERFIPDGHSHEHDIPLQTTVEFDADADQNQKFSSPSITTTPKYAFTLGLVLHALADGLALGVSEDDLNLSVVVFVALCIHKAPTALALTSTLLASSLSRTECKKHLAVFSASTPLAALATYFFLHIFAVGNENTRGLWTGTALLISGGTFLYVATVLQPKQGENGSKVLAVTVFGIFVPVVLGKLLGGHAH